MNTFRIVGSCLSRNQKSLSARDLTGSVVRSYRPRSTTFLYIRNSRSLLWDAEGGGGRGFHRQLSFVRRRTGELWPCWVYANGNWPSIILSTILYPHSVCARFETDMKIQFKLPDNSIPIKKTSSLIICQKVEHNDDQKPHRSDLTGRERVTATRSLICIDKNSRRCNQTIIQGMQMDMTEGKRRTERNPRSRSPLISFFFFFFLYNSSLQTT